MEKMHFKSSIGNSNSYRGPKVKQRGKQKVLKQSYFSSVSAVEIVNNFSSPQRLFTFILGRGDIWPTDGYQFRGCPPEQKILKEFKKKEASRASTSALVHMWWNKFLTTLHWLYICYEHTITQPQIAAWAQHVSHTWQTFPALFLKHPVLEAVMRQWSLPVTEHAQQLRGCQ